MTGPGRQARARPLVRVYADRRNSPRTMRVWLAGCPSVVQAFLADAPNFGLLDVLAAAPAALVPQGVAAVLVSVALIDCEAVAASDDDVVMRNRATPRRAASPLCPPGRGP